MTTTDRWAWADVDLTAVAHNIETLRAAVAPSELWAVVKADGYGHGAVPIARQALRSGAQGLAVALVAEGVELRAAGVAGPILVLSEQPVDQIPTLVEHRLTPTVYTVPYATALVDAVTDQLGDEAKYAVHVNVDTGMQRVGVAARDAVELIAHLATLAPVLEVVGVFTHLACADDPDPSPSALQLASFDEVLAELDTAGLTPSLIHAANSAAALAIPNARRSFVRAGIAVYGISPGDGVDHLVGDLRPVMSLTARVSLVKRVAAGSHVAYGWRHRFERDTTLVTVPIGYADGVPRRLGTLPDRAGAHVLIGGRRHPIVGVVTMDQLMVDVGDADVAVGDRVVLIGTDGDEQIRAEEWADRLGTIGYEIVCGISKRVPRVLIGQDTGQRDVAS